MCFRSGLRLVSLRVCRRGLRACSKRWRTPTLVDKYRKKAAEEQEKARAREEHEMLKHKVQEARRNSQNGEVVAAAHGRVARQIC